MERPISRARHKDILLCRCHRLVVFKALPEGEGNSILIQVEGIRNMGAESAFCPFRVLPAQIILVFFSGAANCFLYIHCTYLPFSNLIIPRSGRQVVARLATRAINDNLQQQASTLYGKYFPYTVTDDLPAGWRVSTVGEIVEIHDSKRIPLSGAQRAKMEKRIYPYYGAASLMDYVDEYIFDGKYLLLGEDGTVVDDAGYPILQYVWGQFWVNNHAHILTGKLGFNVESLLLLFKRTPVKSIVTGAVQPKISQANLRSIQVVVPPRPELDAFNELIRPLFDQIRQNQDQNKALASLRDALLPKLMSGEIDVSGIQL